MRFFVHQNNGEEMFFGEQEIKGFFPSISLIELFTNCSESKDNAFVGRTVSGSMKMM
jgi:hypothetical protein